jgi:hypothetical protein
VANEFIRQLLASGLEVSDRSKEVDAVLVGRVTDYKTGDKFMVFLGNTSTVNAGGQMVAVTNPVVSLGGAPITSKTAAFGVPHSEIIAVNATVAIAARLSYAAGGTVAWADEFSYEGLDIQDAVRAAVGGLVNSLRRVVPRTPGGLPVKPLPVEGRKS